VNLFKQRKNKRFNYTPRHLKKDESQIGSSLESQWEQVKASNKRKRSIFTSLPFLVLFLITVLIVLYLLNQYETA
jgi:hypothetical protein